MMIPPIAGPTARLTLTPTLLAVIAGCNWAFGTSCGTIDCQAGDMKAPVRPLMNVNSSRFTGVATPSETMAAYAAETADVIGTGAGSSGPGFTALVDHLRQGIRADQAVFTVNAASGSGAFGGLDAGVVIAALLMAAGCAWGLSRRLAEYR